MAIGKKTGGRQVGSRNKRTIAKRDELARMIDKGISPLEYMLDVMRDETRETEERLEAAKASAPYIHPRLSAIQHTGKDGDPIQVEEVSTTTEELKNRLKRLAGRASGA
jgi:hypothetical protein